MKKLLSIIGTISLITSGSRSLIACNNTTLTSEELAKLKEENSKTISGNKLEWIAPQEKPFNTVDDKWYVVICRGDKNHSWEIVKFKNNFKDNKFKVIKKLKSGELTLLYNMDYDKHLQVGYDILKKWISKNINNNYFKSVYRWYEPNESPMLKINSDGEIIN